MKDAELKGALAAIYDVDQRQVHRWLAASAPIFVARRMKSHLLSQSNPGVTGSRLQNPVECERIQKKLDALFGDDLARSSDLLDALVELEETNARAIAIVKGSGIKERRAFAKAFAAIATTLRSVEDVEITLPFIAASEEPNAST